MRIRIRPLGLGGVELAGNGDSAVGQDPQLDAGLLASQILPMARP